MAESFDVVIVGGGPAGLAGALTLGRSRKRVLLCDSGPRRNAAAEHIHNFVTRDGTPPDEFRRIAREQLGAYPNVQVRDVRVSAITGERGAFRVALASGEVKARRVLLCTGMIDELPELEGFRELWGHAIFQCPYCHAWEVQDRPWGYLARPEHAAMMQHFALQALAWTRDLTVFTDGRFDVPAETLALFESTGIGVVTAPITRLVADGQTLQHVELADGRRTPCHALFVHPPQRQVDLVRAMGLGLDEEGYVRIDPMKRETTVPGIYAAGDLTTRMQGAVLGAAAAVQASAMINAELTADLARAGAL